MDKKNKEQTPMEKLTSGYESFMKGKQLNKKSKTAFEKAIKKSANSKPRGLK